MAEENIRNNELIRSFVGNLGKPIPTEDERQGLPTREELLQMASSKGITHMGGPVPAFLQGVVTEARDTSAEGEVSGGVIGEIPVSDATLDVLSGTRELESLGEEERVIVDSELDQLGFNSSEVPGWFAEAAEIEGIDEIGLIEAWTDVRTSIVGTSGGEEIVDTQQEIIEEPIEETPII